MIKSSIIGLLFFAFSLSYAQDRMKRINDLQIELDKIKAEKMEPKDKGNTNPFSTLESERDSLKIIVELLKAELLISESKLRITETNLLEKQKQLQDYTAFNSEHAGYYIVVNSERSQEESQNEISLIQSKYPGYAFKIYQNKRKTWFHVCITTKYNKENVGKEVRK